MTGRRPATAVLAAMLAGACSVMVLIGVSLASGAVAADDFYTPPVPLPAGSPGEVIKSEPMTAYALPGVPLPAKATRIMYQSTLANGDPVAVTGTVLVPTSDWTGPGERPLIGFAPGTQGMADRCALSRQWDAGTEYESAAVTQMLLKGWAVAVTDYQGLGTPGDHTYVVNRTLGRNVLDAVRAARNLPDASMSSNGPLGIYGYSEGGGAAASALQLQPTYAPDLPVTGGAVGATVADYLKMLPSKENSPFFWLIFYAAIGFDAAYPELDLPSYLTPTGVQYANQVREDCVQDSVIRGLATVDRQTSTYAEPSPLTSPDWLKRLKENDLGYVAPQAPVLIAGSRLDEVFPFEQEQLLYQRWCERGVNAHLIEIPVPEHLVVGVAFALPAISFLADRFDDEPLDRADDCVAGAGEEPLPTPSPSPTPTITPSPTSAPDSDDRSDDDDSDDPDDDSDDDSTSRRHHRNDDDPVVPLVILGGL